VERHFRNFVVLWGIVEIGSWRGLEKRLGTETGHLFGMNIGVGSWEDGRWCWKIKWRRPFFMEVISSVQMLVIEGAWTCQV
jgi:hypothetical protein